MNEPSRTVSTSSCKIQFQLLKTSNSLTDLPVQSTELTSYQTSLIGYETVIYNVQNILEHDMAEFNNSSEVQTVSERL